MDFRAVERRSLSDAVFDQLRESILSGRFAAGSALPSERILCQQFGVNRSALREALKRLQQLRLVGIRQGESTRVLDFRRTGGLELLTSMLFDEHGALVLPAARSFVEMRVALGPDIARLAAERRRAEHLSQLEGIVAQMRDTGEAVELQRLNLELWRQLVLASDNIAYQLAFNTMEQVWTRVQDLLAHTLLPELTHFEGRDALLGALQQHEPERARRHAHELVRRGSDPVLALLRQLEEA